MYALGMLLVFMLVLVEDSFVVCYTSLMALLSYCRTVLYDNHYWTMDGWPSSSTVYLYYGCLDPSI